MKRPRPTCPPLCEVCQTTQAAVIGCGGILYCRDCAPDTFCPECWRVCSSGEASEQDRAEANGDRELEASRAG